MPDRSVAEICTQLAQRPEALEAVASGRSYVPLLVLLEQPMLEVQSQLQPSLVAAGVPVECAATISPERLVVFALLSWGTHWPSLAISWLEAGMPIGTDIANALESISQDNKLPQSLRHRAFALAKRWLRSQSGQEQNDA